MILLDTDIMIDLLRQYAPAVGWLASLGEEEIALPGYVATEMIQGCRDNLEQDKVEKTLREYTIVWPEFQGW